jgi:hypothetical protein
MLCGFDKHSHGRTLKLVVVRKARDFGVDRAPVGRRKRKLREMSEWEVPGLGPLGDYLHLHSNESGLFGTEAYAQPLLEDFIGEHALLQEQWSLLLRAAAPTHTGKLDSQHK